MSFALVAVTHEKTIVIDSTRAAVVSWNWLSSQYHQRLAKFGTQKIKPEQRRELTEVFIGDVVEISTAGIV